MAASSYKEDLRVLADLPPSAGRQLADEPAEVSNDDDIQLGGGPVAPEPPKPVTGTRRTAPKVSADVYSGWKDRVDDNEYAYARSPTGNEFVILRAPADKQHLVGAKLSPDTVAGSPRLQRSYDAIKAKVEESLPAAKAWKDAADKMQTPAADAPVDAETEAALVGSKGATLPSTAEDATRGKRSRPLDRARKIIAGSNRMRM